MKHKAFLLVTSVLLTITFITSAQIPGQPQQPTSGQISEMMAKLGVLGSALYVAAHPDDENTRLISWLSNHEHVQTTYLSLTRGGGGQNLIGTEMRELLGVLRTQELLQARSVDGGTQAFSRAIDFGYSKNSTETLTFWDHKEVLADVVWTIRKTRPDVIVTRFNADSDGKTHGHHTASAMLAAEAFTLAGDTNAYPEQLNYVEPWTPKRLFFNTSWWFYGSRDAFAEADKSDMISVDVGIYYPALGKSNNEIAAEARSMHKCQGFGSDGTRGSQKEWLQLKMGQMPENGEASGPFDGLDLSWDRLEGGRVVGDFIRAINNNYKANYPAASVPSLVQAYRLMAALPDSYWKKVKMQECKKLIAACMGLYIEAVADRYWTAAGDSVNVTVEILNRSAVSATMEQLRVVGMNSSVSLDSAHQLNPNQTINHSLTFVTAPESPITSPYWLNQPSRAGISTVDEQHLRGFPETPRKVWAEVRLTIEGQEFIYHSPVIHKKSDPVKAVVYRPLETVPAVFVDLDEQVYLFADTLPQKVRLRVKAGTDSQKGQVRLTVPTGWRVMPEFQSFDLKEAEEEVHLIFTVIPPEQNSEGLIEPHASIGFNGYSKGLDVVEYDHILPQTVVTSESARLVRLNLKNTARNIGYIMGAGDRVPESLRTIGCDVTLLEAADMTPEKLAAFDAVVVGIRAFNTNDWMRFHNDELFAYVKEGGTVVVQYNTAHRLVTKDIAPHALKLSRSRVTDETSEVRLLAPDHVALSSPNKIEENDFDGWIQERGLYFPGEWSEDFTPLLSCSDPGEDPLEGSVLVAPYGEGWYVYTGLSFFRELPAGVPGAFKLFANLISLGVD